MSFSDLQFFVCGFWEPFGNSWGTPWAPFGTFSCKIGSRTEDLGIQGLRIGDRGLFLILVLVHLVMPLQVVIGIVILHIHGYVGAMVVTIK